MKTLILALIACLTLFVAAPTWAQTLDEETTAQATTAQATTATTTQTSETTSGKVTLLAGTTLTIMTGTGQQMTFTMVDQSMLPANLQPGQLVRVEYKSATDGAYHLTSVTPLSTTQSTTADPTGDTDATLPHTASLLPLLGVVGLVTITAGLVVRSFTRRQGNV